MTKVGFVGAKGAIAAIANASANLINAGKELVQAKATGVAPVKTPKKRVIPCKKSHVRETRDEHKARMGKQRFIRVLDGPTYARLRHDMKIYDGPEGKARARAKR